jgi:hypothetical protein
MEDGVVAVLPALVGEAVLRLAVVLDEAVAVAVAVGVAPGERRLDLGPEGLDRRAVARALEVLPGEHHEEGSCVDRAVVAAEGDLAEVRHLAEAALVKDLSGLGVRRRVECRGLGRREVPQDAAREGGIEPQEQHRGDDPVAPEHRRVPGNAGIRVRPVPGLAHQHVEVGGRAAGDVVEGRVRALNRRDPGRARPQGPPRVAIGGEEGGRGRLLLTFPAGDSHQDRAAFLRAERHLERRPVTLQAGRRRREAQLRAAQEAVEPLVAVGHAVRRRNVDGALAAADALDAADLEQVAKIGVEAQVQAEPSRTAVVVAQPDPLVGDALPEELGAVDGDDVPRRPAVLVEADVRVGEVNVQRGVVVLDDG